MKKLLSFLLVLVVLLSITIPANALEATSEFTIEEFQRHLEVLAKSDLKAQIELDKFNNLTINEQARVVEIINDGTLMKEVLEAFTSHDTNFTLESARTFGNDDVQVTHTLLSSVNGEQFWEESIKTLGVTLTTLKINVKFRYDTSNWVVTETLSANNSHWNINPGIIVTNQSTDHYTNGTLAEAWGNFNFYVTASGGFYNYTVTINIQCDALDKVGWLTNG